MRPPRGVVLALALGCPLTGGLAGDGGGQVREAARDDVRSLVAAGQHDLEAANYAAAEASLRRALSLAESRLDTDDLQTAWALNALGMLAKYTARFDEGHDNYLRALAIAVRSGAGDPLLVADLYHNLGGLEHAREAFAAGEPFARRGLEIRI